MVLRLNKVVMGPGASPTKISVIRARPIYINYVIDSGRVLKKKHTHTNTNMNAMCRRQFMNEVDKF
jgi:hypothetical protein